MAAFLRRVVMNGFVNIILLLVLHNSHGGPLNHTSDDNPPFKNGNFLPKLNNNPANEIRQAKSNVDTNTGMKQSPRNVHIAESDECAEDVARLCSTKTIKTHNFAILDCLQSDMTMEKAVSQKCQHYIWSYKHNLTRDDRFEAAGKEVCKQALMEVTECKQLQEGTGERIPCLIEFMDNITDTGCQQFLNKMAKIVFSDYRLVWHFMEHCKADIETYKCGRISAGDEEKLHSQGKVILCLAQNISHLQPLCKKQVLRVAELQSDDYHLDRPLYYACRDSRELFCSDTHAGGGKVFECLFKHKNERGMAEECRRMLTVRQQMMAEDVRVEKTFFSACKKAMIENRCLLGEGGQETTSRSRVLLCLENALKQDKNVAQDCIAQMSLLRRQLMSDYAATPEIVTKCSREINKYCEGGLNRGGKTIHCLMKFANIRNTNDPEHDFGVACRAALQDLLRETDVAEDITVDQVLQEACAPVLVQGCKNVPSNKVIDCLMDKIDSDYMTDDCEEKLLEIQYFIVRDFKLDPDMYKGCHKEAKKLCSAPDNWFDDSKPTAEVSGHVFACLYRHMKDDKASLSNTCASQVKRLMRRRAKRIDLEPEIEDNCLHDLAAFCSDVNTRKKGMEMQCLQDNLDNLDEKCHEAVAEFTEDEDEDLNLDTILMKACTPMIKKFCSELLEHETEAETVMNCLIEHKQHRDMDEKCAAGVEHHQIIQLKDIRFNHVFKEACGEDVRQHCPNMKNKTQIVTCLSELVRKSILLEESHDVSLKCRKQLQNQVLQRGESINLDPELLAACVEDMKKFQCSRKTGSAGIIECLRTYQADLTSTCHKVLFKREQDEVVLGADFTLFRVCKDMIKTHCSQKDAGDVLDCLKSNMNEKNFDSNCRQIVLKRSLMETRDYRLNPSLVKSCRMDIPKFCKNVTNTQTQDSELEGKVINCLKMQFIKKRLSRDCHMEIKQLVEEVHQDINMDPVLMHACMTQIRAYCGREASEHEQNQDTNLVFRPSVTGDKVVECLEQKLMEGKIDQASQCAREVLRIIEEAHVDVNIDPELYTACMDDLSRFCRDIESGEGKKMSCLLSVLEDYPDKMKPKCNRLLVQRKTLWEFAAKSAPAETLSDLSQQVMSSPAKSYLLGTLLTLVGIIFIVGITCGRVTKRVSTEMKNR